MPINPIDKPDQSMSAVALVRQLTPKEKEALVRGFLMAVERGLVDTEDTLTVDQKEPMKELYLVIEKYWHGG